MVAERVCYIGGKLPDMGLDTNVDMGSCYNDRGVRYDRGNFVNI
jgi:hypothetical protein